MVPDKKDNKEAVSCVEGEEDEAQDETTTEPATEAVTEPDISDGVCQEKEPPLQETKQVPFTFFLLEAKPLLLAQ